MKNTMVLINEEPSLEKKITEAKQREANDTFQDQENTVPKRLWEKMVHLFQSVIKDQILTQKVTLQAQELIKVN